MLPRPRTKIGITPNLLRFRSEFTRPDLVIDPRITFSRASNATRWDFSATLQTVAGGIARAHANQDHDPTTYRSSATSMAIGYGTKTFADTLARTVGTTLRISYNASNYMFGRITASDGMFTSVTVLLAVGSGTYTAWHLIRPLGFLLEEQRTNSHLHSQDATNAAWGTATNLSLSLASGTAPDGTNTLNQALETSATGLHAQEGTAFTFVTSTVYTYSIFVQSVGGRDFELGFPVTVFTARFAKFNLANGTVRSSDAGVTATINAVGGGTYRVSISAACASGASARVSYFVNQTDGTRNYAGDITKGVKVWGAQLEAGAFPTSYIATTTAAAVRLADVASITGSNFTAIWSASEGTVVVFGDINTLSTTLATTYRIDDTTDNERIFVRNNGSGALVGFGIDGGVTQFELQTGNTLTSATQFRHALAYKLNDIATAFNGGNVLTDGTATLPAVTRLLIGGSAGGDYLGGHIQSLAIYAKRLPNTTLQSLTV